MGFGEGVSPPHWGEVWGGGSVPSPENFLILYLKMATFSALWALFCTVQLHVFQVKSSALGLKNCCCDDYSLFVYLFVCLFVMCIKVQGTYTHTKKLY